jgi:hypothetical protein
MSPSAARLLEGSVRDLRALDFGLAFDKTDRRTLDQRRVNCAQHTNTRLEVSVLYNPIEAS